MNSTTVDPSIAPKVLQPNLDEGYAKSALEVLSSSSKLAIRASHYGHESYLERPVIEVGAGLPRRFFLPDYAVVSISGDDAASFLQGQLTNDVLALEVGQSQLAAFCTAKGRMLASGWLCREASTRYLWVVSTPLAQALQKRLSMFVMRAKAKVLWEQEFIVFGQRYGANLRASFTATGMADAVLLISDKPASSAIWNEPGFVQADSQAWRLLEIQSGVARVSALTSELFVPQMVNFELVGGVNFKKGCYPGQEVVARSQYLGKLKRRMYRVQGEASVLPKPGDDVWSKDASAEPVGQVVAAAIAGSGFECLVESQTDAAANEQGFILKFESGEVALKLAELPYAFQKIA